MRLALTVNSFYFYPRALVALVALGLHLPVLAQSHLVDGVPSWGRDQRISGKIRSAQPKDLSGLRVEIVSDIRAPVGARRTEVGFDGEFEVWGTFKEQSEPYELRILNVRGEVIQRDYVFLGVGRAALEVELRESAERPVQGTVSMNELLIPRKARKHFSQAEKALKAGKTETSLEHLRKAIEIYPEFVAAHNNLGLRYLERNDHSLAETQFRRALELDSSCAFAHGNLAASLYQTKRFEEAEESARRSLQIEPRSPKVRYLLGLILEIRGFRESALAELRSVSNEVPLAHLAVARILINDGQTAAATTEVQVYLSSNDRKHRSLAAGLLQELETLQGRSQATP